MYSHVLINNCDRFLIHLANFNKFVLADVYYFASSKLSFFSSLSTVIIYSLFVKVRDFFLCCVDQFIFHISLLSSKSTIFIHLSQENVIKNDITRYTTTFYIQGIRLLIINQILNNIDF